jgi:hypothetical protein
MENTETKVCSKCGETKKLFLFRKNRNECLECHKKWKHEWMNRNRERVNDIRREKYSNLPSEKLEEMRKKKRKENLTTEQIENHNRQSREYWNLHKEECNTIRRTENMCEEDILLKRKMARKNRIRRREVVMLSDAKRRAKSKGWDFDITIEDIVIPDICPVLGIPINRDNNFQQRNNSPSLDRIDSSKGYVKGNVRVISWRANRLKNDATLDELKRIVEYVERNV